MRLPIKKAFDKKFSATTNHHTQGETFRQKWTIYSPKTGLTATRQYGESSFGKCDRILEVGSYEGKSTTFIVECLGNINDLEIHCIDSWEGGIEHRQGEPAESNMREVEARFEHNMKIAINKSTRAVKLEVHRGLSKRELPKLVANGMQGYFDFIY